MSYHTTYEPVGSMIPAGTWRAVYAYEEDGKYAHADQLVVFALTKVEQIVVTSAGRAEVEDTYMQIVGYGVCDGTIEPAEDTDNFIGYIPGEEIGIELEREAKRYVERKGKT